MSDIATMDWRELDRIYTIVRRELSVRCDWQYGPTHICLDVIQILSKLDVLGGIKDKTFCHLNCGSFHPFGVSIVLFLNGAASCIATHGVDFDTYRTAEAISDLLLDVYASPEKWNFSRMPLHLFVDRLKLFDVGNLRAGNIEEGLRATPLKFIKSNIEVLDLPSSHVDVLFSRANVESYLDFSVACRNMFRILKDNGIAINVLSLLDKNIYQATDCQDQSLVSSLDECSNRGLTKEYPIQLKNEFTKAGFELVSFNVGNMVSTRGFLESISEARSQISEDDQAETVMECIVRKEKSQRQGIRDLSTSAEYEISLPEKQKFSLSLNQDNGWSDKYGALYVASSYCGLHIQQPTFTHIWQHGCFGPWQSNHRMRFYDSPTARNRKIFVARKDEVDSIHELGLAQAYAIGLPIVYLPEVALKRFPRSLLVMPQFVSANVEAGTQQLRREYVEQVSQYKDRFDLVVACVSPHCIKNGFYVDDFEKAGIEVVEGASADDINAYLRVKCLLSQFESMTTNVWGSNVAYALYCGAKVSIFGNKIYPSIADFKKEEVYLNLDIVEIEKTIENEYCQSSGDLAKFLVTPDQAVADADYGKWLVGHNNRLAPEELRQQFGW